MFARSFPLKKELAQQETSWKLERTCHIELGCALGSKVTRQVLTGTKRASMHRLWRFQFCREAGHAGCAEKSLLGLLRLGRLGVLQSTRLVRPDPLMFT